MGAWRQGGKQAWRQGGVEDQCAKKLEPGIWNMELFTYFCTPISEILSTHINNNLCQRKSDCREKVKKACLFTTLSLRMVVHHGMENS